LLKKNRKLSRPRRLPSNHERPNRVTTMICRILRLPKMAHKSTEKSYWNQIPYKMKLF
jgi:hypothetical protein